MSKRNHRTGNRLLSGSYWLIGTAVEGVRISMFAWGAALAISGLASSAWVMMGASAAPDPSSTVERNANSNPLTNASPSDSGRTDTSPAASSASEADLNPAVSSEANAADPAGSRSDSEVPPEAPERRSSLGAALQTIREQLQRQERPLGSRGSQCPYSPGLVGANDTIWSDRPVFLWRSTGQTLSLYDYETDELLWQQQVEADIEAVVYDGESLQPGGLYRWVLMHPETSDFTATFVVMEAEEREALSAELQQEQERWTAAGLTTAEQALERAMFFGDRRLWSDALPELHAVRDSAEVDDAIYEISVYLCGTLESDIQVLENNREQS